ncbi:hypothetical protein ACFV9W_34635 [Streptomyces sp. NPDC059897]|uniref:hypothetical protein n=1 Tax=Streptomyces sp. NPDC059897 TaxID=3346994 RepID=UPI003652D2D3
MNTALNYLAVLFVFLLLAAPSLYGMVHDRRIDRQLKAAAARDPQGRATRYEKAA